MFGESFLESERTFLEADRRFVEAVLAQEGAIRRAVFGLNYPPAAVLQELAATIDGPESHLDARLACARYLDRHPMPVRWALRELFAALEALECSSA